MIRVMNDLKMNSVCVIFLYVNDKSGTPTQPDCIDNFFDNMSSISDKEMKRLINKHYPHYKDLDLFYDEERNSESKDGEKITCRVELSFTFNDERYDSELIFVVDQSKVVVKENQSFSFKCNEGYNNYYGTGELEIVQDQDDMSEEYRFSGDVTDFD